MLKEKAGVIAGTIWNALNETEGMTAKQLKKATKLVDKDLFLGLGWLLREDVYKRQARRWLTRGHIRMRAVRCMN